MKIPAVLLAAAGAGYLFGTRSGRAQFQQLKTRVKTALADPTVRRNVANGAGYVKKSADKVPHPAAKLVTSAATKVEAKFTEPTPPPAA